PDAPSPENSAPYVPSSLHTLHRRGSDLHHDDEIVNHTTTEHFSEIAKRRFTRRALMTGGVVGAAAFVAGGRLLGASPAAAWSNAPARPGRGEAGPRPLLGFDPVPLGFGDEVVVPPGYTVRAFIPWGTPLLGSFPEFAPGENSADEQAQQVGMHHDGMH